MNENAKNEHEGHVVSWGLFDDFYNSMSGFIGKMKFLSDGGFSTNEHEIALNYIDDELINADEAAEKFRGKMHEETRGQDVALEYHQRQKSLFKFMEDPRFIEYKSQIELDGGNITNILESWLKENKPDYFED